MTKGIPPPSTVATALTIAAFVPPWVHAPVCLYAAHRLNKRAKPSAAT